jgi:hypothetical protein
MSHASRPAERAEEVGAHQTVITPFRVRLSGLFGRASGLRRIHGDVLPPPRGGGGNQRFLCPCAGIGRGLDSPRVVCNVAGAAAAGKLGATPERASWSDALHICELAQRAPGGTRAGRDIDAAGDTDGLHRAALMRSWPRPLASCSERSRDKALRNPPLVAE